MLFNTGFLFYGYWDPWTAFSKINAWSYVPTMKGLKYLSNFHEEEQVGEYSMVSWLLRHLHRVCYRRWCDALGMSLALGSVKSTQQEHQGFTSSSGCHFSTRMKDVNKVRLLEMFLGSWKSWCLHFFLPMLALSPKCMFSWFTQTRKKPNPFSPEWGAL